MVSIGEITGTVRSMLRESKGAKAKPDLKMVKPTELIQPVDKAPQNVLRIINSQGITDDSERRIMEAYYA